MIGKQLARLRVNMLFVPMVPEQCPRRLARAGYTDVAIIIAGVMLLGCRTGRQSERCQNSDQKRSSSVSLKCSRLRLNVSVASQMNYRIYDGASRNGEPV
jgi:hypothetical protein